MLVGYRWYDTRAMDVAYPFGHGLSYTTFGYSDVTASADGTDVTVTATITNTGSVAGAEVVQVYVRDPQASVLRPTRELKAFAKVALEPGESREVTFALTGRDLSYWHPGLHRWVVEGGEFVVEVGASSRDIRGVGLARGRGRAAVGRADADVDDRGVVRAPRRRTAAAGRPGAARPTWARSTRPCRR